MTSLFFFFLLCHFFLIKYLVLNTLLRFFLIKYLSYVAPGIWGKKKIVKKRKYLMRKK